MKDPVTSKKCPHSFEKEAIEEMIGHSSTQVGGSGRQGIIDGTRALRCPVCSVVSLDVMSYSRTGILIIHSYSRRLI